MSSKKRGRTAEEVAADPQSKRILSSAQAHSRNVAAIIIGVCNPEYIQLGLRFRDPYNAEDTAVYYVWAKVSSSKLWPQAVVTGLPLAFGSSVDVPRSHGPVNQFTQFLFHGLMRRWIHDYKNKDKIYTSYRLFGTDGYIDFLVDNCGALTEWTDLKIGGAIYDDTLLSGAIAAGGAQNPYATMAAGGLTAANINFECVHEPVMAPGEFRGDTYMYNDGCSLATLGSDASTAKVVINNPSPATATDGTAGFIKSGLPATTVPLTPTNFARNVTGSLNLAHGSTPLPAGTRFAVQVIGYNEGQPYELLHTSFTGTIPATPLTDQVFFSYPIGLPDYYRVRFSCMAGSDGVIGGSAIRAWFINTGEMWAHRETPHADLNYKSIRAHRGFGTTLLATNDTPLQTKGGRAATAQLPLGQDWMTVQDGGDPFAYVTEQLREKDKNFTLGHYSWLRLADVKETMMMRQEIIPTPVTNRSPASISGGTGQQPQTFSYPLFKIPVLAQVCTSPEGDNNKQTVLWTLACNGEYTTGNQWNQDGMATYSSMDWEEANEEMSTMDQGMENETHAAQIAATAGKVGKGMASAKYAKETLPWIGELTKNLEESARSAAPMLLPIMSL